MKNFQKMGGSTNLLKKNKNNSKKKTQDFPIRVRGFS